MAHHALQVFGGAATTVVLAACYGGFDKPTVTDSGFPPYTGVTTGTTSTGTGTGSTAAGACGAPAGTFAVTVLWNDDGAVPTDSDSDGVNDTGCDADTVDVCIQDPLGQTDWTFGMVEDGANGWKGEDCLAGQGAYLTCHSLTAPTDSVAEVCTPNEVADGFTLLDAAKDPFLTYYLADATGACFVFGTDTAYYASLSCTEML